MSIGADRVIDYTREDFADGQRRHDLILDIGGNRSPAHLRRALTATGTLSEAPDAIRYIEAGRARGKILLTI